MQPRRCHPTFNFAFWLCVSFGALSAGASAQNCATERIIAPKSKIEETVKKLQMLKGASLPTLEGFADTSAGPPLERYRRGFFQYSVQVTPSSPAESEVRVCAKITAWLEENGYRELASNGRLENDFFDRIKEALALKPAEPRTSAQVWKEGQSPSDFSAHYPSALKPEAVPAISDDKRLKELTQKSAALEEILKNQSHPRDLVAVKQDRTPIMQQPAETAKVLFYAAAQDEFQKLTESAGWTHVQISGLSRGWIRTSMLEGAAETTGPSLRLENKNFRITREEVGSFPGDWKPLNGKQVKIFWVQPIDSKPAGRLAKMNLASSLFRESYSQVTNPGSDLAGVVIVFDSADGLLAAATSETLQQWHTGHLSTAAFWKQCWSDPADAFQAKQ